MSQHATKTIPGLKEAGAKVRRSEFEDATFRSLGREETRLNHALKEYDKAKKVVQKELAYDERLALKASKVDKFPQSVVRIYSLQPRPSSGFLKSDAKVRNGHGLQTCNNNTANNNGFPAKFYRAKTAKAAGSQRSRSSVVGDDGDKLTESCQTKYYVDSENLQEYSEPTKQPNRKELFDYLSIPKNRSKVIGVRERLRQEFENPRPRTAIAGSNRRITMTDTVGMIRGRAFLGEVSHLSRSRTFHDKKITNFPTSSSVTHSLMPQKHLVPLNSSIDYDLPPESVQALLNTPTPVIVRGRQRCDTSLPD